jgi:endonuclease-8
MRRAMRRVSRTCCGRAPVPEGPTLLMLSEEAAVFRGKTVRRASGTAKLDLARMRGKRVRAIRTWGKHLLIGFAGFTLRVHLLLFGSWRIDDRKAGRKPSVRLEFDNGELEFYASALKYVEGDIEVAYDWAGDVLADAWDPARARRKLKKTPDVLVADALLDQDVFAGVGNIIKNEVLFRIRVDPASTVGALPPRKLGEMIRQARQYSLDFLAWRRVGALKRNLLVHRRQDCPECQGPLESAVLGTRKRRAYWCPRCQARYPPAKPTRRR